MRLNESDNLFNGFSKLNQQERFDRLLTMGALTADEVHYLQQGGIENPDLANKLIENVIGYFQLPLGVATNFRINNKDYVIPMAVEETSIIAALSKTAKWIRQKGCISTSTLGRCILGQIQLAKITNWLAFSTLFQQFKQAWITEVNALVAHSMVQRGGGVIDLDLRKIDAPNGDCMGIIHLSMDSCDAMGANIINQALEFLKEPIERVTGETVSMCILTNLNDQKITTARVEIKNVEQSLGERLEAASLFAECDPYRAATHNKGVMNGIDPILIATGNDWRAVEAGMHAYAARNGRYSAISTWRFSEGTLVGVLEAPIIVGIVGGVTALHPTAKLCLSMLDVASANELSQVIAAVGLVQNLGAITALCTDGIIKGHMKLHIDNLLLTAGATDAESGILKTRLATLLETNKRLTLSQTIEHLNEIRQVVAG